MKLKKIFYFMLGVSMIHLSSQIHAVEKVKVDGTVPHYAQQKTNWCWAASSKMVNDYLIKYNKKALMWGKQVEEYLDLDEYSFEQGQIVRAIFANEENRAADSEQIKMALINFYKTEGDINRPLTVIEGEDEPIIQLFQEYNSPLLFLNRVKGFHFDNRFTEKLKEHLRRKGPVIAIIISENPFGGELAHCIIINGLEDDGKGNIKLEYLDPAENGNPLFLRYRKNKTFLFTNGIQWVGNLFIKNQEDY